MIRGCLLVLGVLCLSACTTIYTPEEWPISEGNIPQFPISGNVSITNGQPLEEPTIVYSYVGTKLQSNYREITAMMANVARKALLANGAAAPSDKYKKITLKVTKLHSRYHTLYWKSTMEYEAKLGNGEIIAKQVGHGAGPAPFSPGMLRDLNGCIAQGVVELFNDERVKAYLAM